MWRSSAMPKARYAPAASDVESPRGGEDEEHGEGETAPRSRLGQSVLVVLIVMLAGFGGTAGALWYGETQLTALQVSLERQRAKTEEVLAQHVSALQQLDRAQQEVRRLVDSKTKIVVTKPAKAKVADEDEAEEKPKRGGAAKKEGEGDEDEDEEDGDDEEDDKKKSKKGKRRRKKGRGRR